MNRQPRSRRDGYRRQTHYVGERLQTFLLLALVLLEVALVAGLSWLMWRHLTQIIDDNLYRVHLDHSPSILSLLLREATVLLGWFFVTNLCALLLANLLWQHHVKAVLRHFMALIQKTQALDFSADPTLTGQHQIISLAASQRQQERKRLLQFRAQLEVVTEGLTPATAPAELAEALHSLRQLLPTQDSPAATQPMPRRRRDDAR